MGKYNLNFHLFNEERRELILLNLNSFIKFFILNITNNLIL